MIVFRYCRWNWLLDDFFLFEYMIKRKPHQNETKWRKERKKKIRSKQITSRNKAKCLNNNFSSHILELVIIYIWRGIIIMFVCVFKCEIQTFSYTFLSFLLSVVLHIANFVHHFRYFCFVLIYSIYNQIKWQNKKFEKNENKRSTF